MQNLFNKMAILYGSLENSPAPDRRHILGISKPAFRMEVYLLYIKSLQIISLLAAVSGELYHEQVLPYKKMLILYGKNMLCLNSLTFHKEKTELKDFRAS